MADLAGEVGDLQCLASVRRMLALDRPDRRGVGAAGDEKDGSLATVLRFAEDLDRAAEPHFAHLRAEILESAPADRVQREVAPAAVRAALMRNCRFGLGTLGGHAAPTP